MRNFRFRFKARAHGLPAPLIVSLTSYPPRYSTLALSLRALLSQTVQADHTILWIAHEDFDLLPQNVLDLQQRGLEIRRTDDTRSFKKILPALDAFPAAYLCTADDDLYYRFTWLEELVDEIEDSNCVVPCHRAHQISFDASGLPRPYSEWQFEVTCRTPSARLFPTSGAGVIFPPGVLKHQAADRASAFQLCPFADDIWLFWMGRRNGALYKTTARQHKLWVWPESQQLSLWKSNAKGGNDLQIKRMTERYGFPEDSCSPASHTQDDCPGAESTVGDRTHVQ